jgi:HEAT repeats
MPRVISILFVAILLAAGCDSFDQASHDVRGMFGFAQHRTPRQSAAKVEDPYFPDERREGINELVSKDFGKRPPYTTRYAQIAKLDDDWLVRATAVRALNRARDRQATSVFVDSLNDKNEQVRLEACKALIHMPDENAVPGLVRLVQSEDENHDVRIAAAEALEHYHTLEVARTLANTLAQRDFGVAWQAHQTLMLITGHDLRYDEAAWLAFLTGPEKPFG